jgi:2'-5' RNA ligase
VKPLSFAQVLDGLLLREKTAEISTSPRTFFVHVRVPDHVVEDLRAVQKRVIPDESKHQDIDHVTLVYTKKPLEDHPPDKVYAALEALRQVGEKTEPINAKIQGWGYFDGASKDGKTTTALVALLDAPGLEHLHVDMSRALKDLGVTPSDNHVFTPHITLGYLGEHGRVDTLPKLSGNFTIDKAHVASRDHHEVPLKGTASSMGQKAASFAVKGAARAGMRQIQQHIGAGNLGAANRLATTPGVLKPSAAGSQLRHLGSGSEGTATLVAHPEHGVAVRKVFDPQGSAGPLMVANKAHMGRALQDHPNVARFLGETPTQIGPAHFSEYVHGTPTAKAPSPLTSLGGEPPLGKDTASAAASVRAAGPPHGMDLIDVGEHNMITTPGSQHKVIDYMPIPKKGPHGGRMDVVDRGAAAEAANRLGVNHALTNYLKDPARPGNLMAQAFRGAQPLVQEHSPPANPKWASLGEEAAAFAMNPRDVQEQHRGSPGKGTTTPSIGGVPLQGSR